MRNSKTKLTQLINKISDTLPDGDDIFGYAGINKSMLIQSIRDSYDLLSCFKEYNTMFEVVFLKRNIASFYEKCNSFLNEAEINSENFEEFLKIINLLRADIKITYILVSQNPLRLDSDIAKAKELLEEFQPELSEISSVKTEILKARIESQEVIDSLTNENQKALENSENIESLILRFQSAADQIQLISNNVESWKNNISSCEISILENDEKSKALLSEFERIRIIINEQQFQIDNQIAKQRDIISKNEEHQKEIRATLDGASKHGLAGSFYTRKKELVTNSWLWGVGTIASIIILIVISYCLIKPLIDNPSSFSLLTYLARIPVFGALVWLGWFCAKQYGYIIRISEEYSFKYAISMAFEGYKKESAEVNSELLDKLLRLTLDSISVSPVHCYDSKTNHATPVNEITESIIKEMKPLFSEVTKNAINKV